MRVLVTGGAGFIGSHLCEFLVGRGDEVICMDNFLTGSPQNLAGLEGRPGFTLARHNVTEYINVPGRSSGSCTSPAPPRRATISSSPSRR